VTGLASSFISPSSSPFLALHHVAEAPSPHCAVNVIRRCGVDHVRSTASSLRATYHSTQHQRHLRRTIQVSMTHHNTQHNSASTTAPLLSNDNTFTPSHLLHHPFQAPPCDNLSLRYSTSTFLLFLLLLFPSSFHLSLLSLLQPL
jgi:hypothetical protein